MNLVYSNGQKSIVVPANQKIAVGVFGEGWAIVRQDIAGDALPRVFRQIAAFQNGQNTYGPFSTTRNTTISIQSDVDNVEYNVGTTPVLTRAFLNSTSTGLISANGGNIAFGGALIDINGNPYALTNPPDSKSLYPSISILSQFQLKKSRAAFANHLASGQRLVIAFIGDSTMMGASANGGAANDRPFCMPDLIAQNFAALGYQTNSNNLFGDNNSSPGGATFPADSRVTMGVGWTVGTAQLSIGGNGFVNSSNSNKFSVAFATAFDTIEVWYQTNPGYGLMDIAVDGGAKIGASVDCNAVASITKTTRTTTLGIHTVDIFKDVADATVNRFFAINCYNSAAPEIECWSWGISGSKSADWIGTGSYLTMGSRIPLMLPAPNLYVIMAGINDALVPTATATYTTQLQTLITMCQAAGGDVILATGIPYAPANEPNQPALNTALYTLAQTNNLPFIDLFSRWQSQALAALLSFYNAPANYHPVKNGYSDMASAVFPFLNIAGGPLRKKVLSLVNFSTASLDSSGTPGAQTSNTPAGRCSIAAAGTSVVITNSLVTVNSKVFAQIGTADATAVSIKSIVKAAGSFTITLGAAATGTTAIDWFVIN